MVGLFVWHHLVEWLGRDTLSQNVGVECCEEGVDAVSTMITSVVRRNIECGDKYFMHSRLCSPILRNGFLPRHALDIGRLTPH